MTSKAARFTIDAISRLAAASLLSVFVWNVYQSYQNSRSFGVLLLLIGEIITVVLVMIARSSDKVDRSPYSWVITNLAMFYFLLLVLDGGNRLLPAVITDGLQVAGIALQIFAKVYLGRSFGLLPADRGIVQGGPYRWVRHPIYLGYFLNHVGFLLSNATLWNLVLYIALYGLQILRMIREERILSANPEYARYMQRVRYRFIPFLV